MAEYYAELKGWKEERDRQAVEFEITGDVDDTQPSVVRDTPFEIYSGPAKYELSSPKRNLDNILNKSQTPFRLTDSDMSKSVTKVINCDSTWLNAGCRGNYLKVCISRP